MGDDRRRWRRCAGATLRRRREGELELLLIRTRARRYELPKGHLEPGETHQQAAQRELCEETALSPPPAPGPLLDELRYAFDGRGGGVRKRVRYFLFHVEGEVALGALPRGVRERRWVRIGELEELPLVSENLRPLLRAALQEIPLADL